jgi:hypothetical protein
MSDELQIITNNVPRDIVDAYELNERERTEFDYLNWNAIDAGEDSASFVRYRGELYDLGEFMVNSNMPEFSPLRAWDGHISDSFFSGVVVRYVQEPGDFDVRIVVGRFYS